jgi:hypothetical protein
MKTINIHKKIEYKWSKYWLKKMLANADPENILKNNDDDTYINWYKISKSSNIYWSFIEKHLNYPWDALGLSLNKNITWNNIINNPQIHWVYEVLGKNPNITLDIILKNPQFNWNMTNISTNPNITLDMIKKYDNYDWQHYFSQNPNVKMSDVIENIKWYFFDLGYNQGITWDDFNIEDFSSNPNLTLDIVLNNPDIDWDYNNISMNSNISWEIIQNNQHIFDEHCVLINLNPNITFDIIENNPHVPWIWDWSLIVLNEMTLERETFFAKKLQKYYIKNIYNELHNYVNNYLHRKSYLMLIEGCQKAYGHIIQYFFNEMIYREVCSFLYSDIKIN